MQGELDKQFLIPRDHIAVLLKDRILEKVFVEGLRSLDDYEHYYHNFRFEYSFLKEKFQNDMGKIRERNKNWDIKIADYIADNYQTVPLFVDRNHPSKYLMLEIGRQTADILGIHDITGESEYEPRLGIPTPILSCVQECFEMNFMQPCEKMRCVLETNLEFGLRDYIKCYMWWYHDISLT